MMVYKFYHILAIKEENFFLYPIIVWAFSLFASHFLHHTKITWFSVYGSLNSCFSSICSSFGHTFATGNIHIEWLLQVKTEAKRIIVFRYFCIF